MYNHDQRYCLRLLDDIHFLPMAFNLLNPTPNIDFRDRNGQTDKPSIYYIYIFHNI